MSCDPLDLSWDLCEGGDPQVKNHWELHCDGVFESMFVLCLFFVLLSTARFG